jgi:hypothetical protein
LTNGGFIRWVRCAKRARFPELHVDHSTIHDPERCS